MSIETDPHRPVIFLDIDGVLNCMSAGEGHHRERVPGGWNRLDREMVNRVNTMLAVYVHSKCVLGDLCSKSPEPLVVVSSSWRRHTSKEFPDPVARLSHVFRENGAVFDVAGITPVVDHCPHRDPLMFPGGCPWRGYCRRGLEILQWLIEDGDADRPVAILDDSTDMGPMMPWLVRTYGTHGLQDFHVDQVLALLRHQEYPGARPRAALAAACP